MMMTLFPNKNKQQIDNKPKIVSRIGITVISSNLTRRQNAINKGTLKLGQKKQELNQYGRVILRSLSTQRDIRKKIKLQNKKSQEKQYKDGMKMEGKNKEKLMMHINQLSAQYDLLKFKRSTLSKQDSQISMNGRLSDFDNQTDIKINQPIALSLLMSKCIPKSKINLHVNHNTGSNKAIKKNYQFNEVSSFTGEKSRLTYYQARQRHFKERRSCNYSQTSLNIQETNQSMCSLNNVSVNASGLRLTLKNKSKPKFESSHKKCTAQSVNRYLFGQQNRRKKGIKVVSNKKSLNSSLSNSSVSLYVSKQIQKQRKEQSNKKQLSNTDRKSLVHINEAKQGLLASCEIKVSYS